MAMVNAQLSVYNIFINIFYLCQGYLFLEKEQFGRVNYEFG